MLHNSLCLARRDGPSKLKRNREFSRDIREFKFPVTGSSSESLLFCWWPCREKRPKFPLHLSRAIFKGSLHERPRLYTRIITDKQTERKISDQLNGAGIPGEHGCPVDAGDRPSGAHQPQVHRRQHLQLPLVQAEALVLSARGARQSVP
jgi:hypothetical protein